MQTDIFGQGPCSRSECSSYDETFPKYVKKLSNNFSQICQNLIKKITNRWRKDNQINFQVHFCLPGLPHPQPHQCDCQHQPPQHLLRGKVHRVWNKVKWNLNLIPNSLLQIVVQIKILFQTVQIHVSFAHCCTNWTHLQMVGILRKATLSPPRCISKGNSDHSKLNLPSIHIFGNTSKTWYV